MRKVKIVEETRKEVFEQTIEFFLGDSQVDIVDWKYSITDEKYSAIFIYRMPSSEG